MTRLWHPRWDCSVVLVSGHSRVVPNNPAGVEVPAEFIREAIKRGCLLVGVTAAQARIASFDRAGMLREALRGSQASAKAPDARMVPGSLPNATALHSGLPAKPEATGATTNEPPISVAISDVLVARIEAVLHDAGQGGATRTQVRDALQRNTPAAKIDVALALLEANGRVRHEILATRGRPRTVWRAATLAVILPSGDTSSSTIEVPTPSRQSTATRVRPKLQCATVITLKDLGL